MLKIIVYGLILGISWGFPMPTSTRGRMVFNVLPWGFPETLSSFRMTKVFQSTRSRCTEADETRKTEAKTKFETKSKSRRESSSSGSEIDTVNQNEMNNIELKPLKVGGERMILPSDYIVNEQYGIGRYLGIRIMDLTPARTIRTWERMVIVEYADAEVSWYERMAAKELWLYRSADSGHQDLSSVVDGRRWIRHKESVVNVTKKSAINLMKSMAVRNAFHRHPCRRDDGEYESFENAFPYEPTEDQQRCFDEVKRDMTLMTRPMDRLICGDVGFGKTEVAVRAVYRAVQAGRQVAFLAPTRILALQHLRVLRNRMPDVDVFLLRGGQSSESAMIHEQIKSGQAQVVVGTHALLQRNIKFKNLGLLIIDEEQRFGVGHKEKLKATSSGVDVLTLSATPIPRTLQISLSGLRDLSLMSSPPIGRKETIVEVGIDDDNTLRDAIMREIKRDGQVFVVVPFVCDVEPTRHRIESLIDKVRVIEAHGRHQDLESRVDDFSNYQADVLVATTVIENGIDMPRVNTILILHSDRFGISALYQLRGRVGRSDRQAYAYFLTPRGKTITLNAETRLSYMATFTALGSGYDLSRRDMELRGYGTIFGTQQSGARDVGIDLQASLLQEALLELQSNVFMPVQTTRVDLGTNLEVLGINTIGPIPDNSDTEALLSWESKLAAVILKLVLQDKASIISELSKFRCFTNVKEVIDWMVKLKNNFNDADAHSGVNSPLLAALVKRKVLVLTGRKLGVSDIIINQNGRILFKFETMVSDEKWAYFKESPVFMAMELTNDRHLQTRHVFKEKSIPDLPQWLLDVVLDIEKGADRIMKSTLRREEE